MIFYLLVRVFFFIIVPLLMKLLVELVAQPVEQRPFKAKVVGSIPTWLTNKKSRCQTAGFFI